MAWADLLIAAGGGTNWEAALLGLPAPWLGQLIYFIGIVTAAGTSFYMFRSYYMTFTGEYRGGHGDGHDAHAAHGHDDHGHHGGTPHESPRSITFVLAVLAALAVLVSILGIPMAWTGKEPLLEQWLGFDAAQVMPGVRNFNLPSILTWCRGRRWKL